MKKALKALLCLTLSLFLCVIAFTSCDKKTQDEPSQNPEQTESLKFLIDNTTSTFYVAGIGNYTDKNVVIPSEHDGLPVTRIGDGAFSACEEIISVTIPESVTSIAPTAFNGCTSLTNVTIPGSVSEIGSGVFNGCEKLTAITIPDGITAIHNFMFKDCAALTDITIPESVTTIGKSAFEGCTGLTNITIKGNITNIGLDAFKDCTSLKSTQYDNAYYIGSESNPYMILVKAIDQSITSCEIHANTLVIENSAFASCSKLNRILIPEGVLVIGSGAFFKCENLIEISIPNSLTTLGDEAFMSCNNIKYTSYNNARYLGNEENPYLLLLRGKDMSITSCEIHGDVKFICDRAFWNFTNLTTLTFNGTKEEWQNIPKGSEWNFCIGTYNVTYTD